MIKVIKNSWFYISVSKSLKEAFNLLIKEKKSTKKIAIVLTITTHHFEEKIKIFPFRYVDNFVCLPIGVKDNKSAIKIVKDFDGKIDVFFVDIENKLSSCYNLFEIVKRTVKTSNVFPIKGNDFSADATFAIVNYFLSGIAGKKICVIGAGNIGSKVALKLLESGAKIYIINSTKKSSHKVVNAINVLKPRECPDKAKAISKKSIPQNLDCIIGFARGSSVITESMICKVKKGGCVLDGGLGTISLSGINEAKKRKISLQKIDIRMGFLSNALLMINTEKLLGKIYGEKRVENFHIVAGGFIGKKGDVVVDSITNTKEVIGIANGEGGLSKSNHFRKNVKLVKKLVDN